jgi:signal transduction histidine kinase
MVPFLVSSISFMTAGALPVPASADDSGTAAEARAMLEKAVAALKANPAEALAKFQKGEDGFKDRDLYVFCIGPDGKYSAQPEFKGQHVSNVFDPTGKVMGADMLKEAHEGKISEMSYLAHRPGSPAEAEVKKVAYFTKVGNQVCGVGYYP